MDENGTEWCKNNKDLILSWLSYEAQKRKLPYVKLFANKLLDLAISRAERQEAKC